MPRPPAYRFSIDLLLQDGPLPAAELRERAGLSPATLSRRVAEAGDKLLRLGQGRATRYALARAPPGLPARLPVYRVDERGTPARVAHVTPLSGGGTWVEGAASAHLRVGLPPVVVDMVPAGFLGRRFAARHADLQLPERLPDWRDDHRWTALARRGEDVVGDLVIGDESMDRLLQRAPMDVDERDYPRLAEESTVGGAGSSAAGEQPKFAALHEGRHRLVKFTPGDGSASDDRWRDLLVCEALALELLAEAGFESAQARIVDFGSRRFLEVERFDRVGTHGRRGTLSLAPLDDELFGARDTWTEAAGRLHAARLLSTEDAHRLCFFDAFGAAIGNDDRHFGNAGFFADGLAERPALRLAPVYDMLPMSLAPRAGVVPPLTERPPLARALHLPSWSDALALAGRYWRRVAEEPRIGPGFRQAAGRLSRAIG